MNGHEEMPLILAESMFVVSLVCFCVVISSTLRMLRTRRTSGGISRETFAFFFSGRCHGETLSHSPKTSDIKGFRLAREVSCCFLQL